MMDKNVIEVKQLSKSFQKTVALQGCDFSVRKGEIFGFFGHHDQEIQQPIN